MLVGIHINSYHPHLRPKRGSGLGFVEEPKQKSKQPNIISEQILPIQEDNDGFIEEFFQVPHIFDIPKRVIKEYEKVESKDSSKFLTPRPLNDFRKAQNNNNDHSKMRQSKRIQNMKMKQEMQRAMETWMKTGKIISLQKDTDQKSFLGSVSNGMRTTHIASSRFSSSYKRKSQSIQ
ncbi:UNKNOWN [Stylonychia lemnae]|uniref:Uncharacterized protein n=1 Tax=Stylonychia lemnae TaxID=5949 RepID=A0A078AXB4_STYLE|nr:UNKNOWN [Stylonychia lemnae]|eukprot:CDW86716.1 UNKNOWN [Stylonychia lemnae]